MVWISRHELSGLQERLRLVELAVERLGGDVKALDPVALQLLRNQVLNALRGLRRTKQAETEEDPPLEPVRPESIGKQPGEAPGETAEQFFRRKRGA